MMVNVRASMTCTQLLVNCLTSMPHIYPALYDSGLTDGIDQGKTLLQLNREILQHQITLERNLHDTLAAFNSLFGVRYPIYLEHLAIARRQITEVGAKYTLGLSAQPAVTRSAQLEYMQRFYSGALECLPSQRWLERAGITQPHLVKALDAVHSLITYEQEIQALRQQLHVCLHIKQTQLKQLTSWNQSVINATQRMRGIYPALAAECEAVLRAPQLAKVETLMVQEDLVTLAS